MKIDVYIREFEVILCSDEFSVDCSLLPLFIRGGFTFKPLRINYRIVPKFLIDDTTDILNFPDLRLEDFYSDRVFVYFDVLNSGDNYKSIPGFVKMRIIEVSREKFKEFILKVLDRVFMSCFRFLKNKTQFEELYLLRTWLYNYFPDIGNISYIEYNLKKLFKDVLCYRGNIL